MYSFNFSAEATLLIGRALDLMPMGQALPVARYMQDEIDRQNALRAEQTAEAERQRIRAAADIAAAQLATSKPKRRGAK
ncbi:hypothetical protein NKJ09_22680 [Mesorhizobium sp. M0189]|uniref:hypothetical protein n=1 Tax=Mesorhizobium sp. M0189 TaxID=2956909 RepID=UPI0033399008